MLYHEKIAMYQDFKTKVLFIFFITLLTILFFDIGRVFLLIHYNNIFNLDTLQIVKSFLLSIRFDLSAMITFYCLPFALMFLPVKSIKYYKFLISIIYLMFFIMTLIMIGDLIYFQESKAHITEELFLALNDIRFIINYAVKQYWLLLLLLILFFYLICLVSIKIFEKNISYKKISGLKNSGILLVLIGALFIAIRGNVSGMPIGTIDIYKLTTNIQEVNLTLNGVFTGIHTFIKDKNILQNSINSDSAYKNIRDLLLSENEKFVDDNYPLMRKITKQNFKQKYNVCIILLESWNFKYIDSLNNTKYGITPCFDNIVKESIVFNNAYAVGTRSMFGLYSIFAGLPLIPGFIAENSSYTYGLELKNLFSIADIFNQNSYYTAYMQTSPVDSNKFFGIMAKTNFRMKETYSEEEIPNYMQYKEKAFYGYDYDLFMFMNDRILKLKKDEPFFILAFTGTTHVPFVKTTDEFEKYPRTTDENKYLNSLYFADYSIGKLIEKAKENKWFDDTIFIFLADHVSNTIENGNSLKDKFHIPFVIYAPKIFKPQQIDYVVSQMDIIPTLAHLFGENIEFTSLGTNALDEKANHCAFICEGNYIDIIDDKNAMRHNRQNILETNVDEQSDNYTDLETKVLSFDKVVSDAFKHNKWFK